MDELKGEWGYTLVETLVCMVILGILVSLTVLFINVFFGNPNILFRSEALNLAKAELNKTVENKLKTDTSYVSLNGNLLVERKIESEELLTTVTIFIKHKPTEKIIMELGKKYRNE